MTKVKICGLKDAENLEVACASGVNYVGFVFYPKSARHINFDTARFLIKLVPSSVQSVGLFVDPDDVLLTESLKAAPFDIIQLHGAETPQRVKEIKELTERPVMKALRVSDKNDVALAESYEPTADWLLFDTKVKGQHGGTGQSFDWSLLQGKTFKKPWMLSGGLNATNVKQALSLLKPDAIDVSSGVETAPGLKNPAKIREFISTVKTNG